MSEQSTEQTIRVRQITDVHANWSSQGPLEHGKFSYQLILDNGNLLESNGTQWTQIRLPTACCDEDGPHGIMD
jgi:hypothetical protein